MSKRELLIALSTVCLFILILGKMSVAAADTGGDPVLSLPLPNDDAANVNSIAWRLQENDDELSLFEAWSKFESGDFSRDVAKFVPFASSSPQWLVIPMVLTARAQSNGVIWLTNGLPLEFDGWLLDASGSVVTHVSTGMSKPYDTRPLNDRRFALPLEIRNLGKHYAVFRVASAGPMYVSLRAASLARFAAAGETESLVQFGFLGMAGLMIFYSAFTFWLLRRRLFLLYGLYLVPVSVAVLCNTEILHRYVWPTLEAWNVRLVFVAAMLGGLMACQLIGGLLAPRELNSWVNRGIYFGHRWAGFGLLLVLVVPLGSGAPAVFVWLLVLMVSLASTCLIAAREGSGIAALLAAGWFAQSCGLVCGAAFQWGWLTQFPVFRYSYMMGSAAEIACFSLVIPMALRTTLEERKAILVGLETVSSSHESGMEATQHAESEIENLKLTWRQENRDLERLSRGYERAQESLSAAQGRLGQAEKMASLGQLIVGVSENLGIKAKSISERSEQFSTHLHHLESQLAESRDIPQEAQLSVSKSASDMRRMFGYLTKGTASIMRMNEALCRYHGHGGEPFADQRVVLILEDICLIVHGRIRQHRLETNVPTQLTLRCRRSQVERVLGNLLTNASDAISDGHPEVMADAQLGTIGVSAALVELDGESWVTICVEDSGPGIPEEKRAAVVQPFVTTKSVHRGTGLGLFTADSILREHGGRLEISTSTHLGGAKITMWFPAQG